MLASQRAKHVSGHTRLKRGKNTRGKEGREGDRDRETVEKVRVRENERERGGTRGVDRDRETDRERGQL